MRLGKLKKGKKGGGGGGVFINRTAEREIIS